MKKIIISENKQLLPKFLYNRATTRNTSLGDNDALPQDGYYPFEYTLLKTRFRDVLEALNSIDGVDTNNIDNIASELNKTISRCKDIERDIRPNLEKVCENVVARIFTIPDETVILKCTLTDKIEPKHGYRIMPEEEDNRNYDFSSLDEISLASKAIKKRRLVNSLIQGATYSCSKNIDFYYDDVATLSDELPSLYEKIRILNDYLLFVKQENITDDKPMQGSYVEVELGRGDEKTIIDAQGLIFPFLLNETVRGFFELFASHGLPKDNSKANYIVSQADFLIAEPWDLRLGVGLWDKLSVGLDDTTLYPYFFKNLCSLKIDEFNSTLKEIFANTKKGSSLLNDLYDEAYHNSQMVDLDYTIKQKNSEVAVLNDEYIAADELDDYMIEEEGEDELSGDLEEYYTPDGLKDDEIHHIWQYGAYPFIDTSEGIVYGDEGDKHNNMNLRVVAALCNLSVEQVDEIKYNHYPTTTGEDEENDSIIQELQDEIGVDNDDVDRVYDHLEGGKLQDKCYLFGRVWPEVGDNYESYLSFWLNNRYDEGDYYYDSGNEETGGQFDVDNASDEWQGNYIPRKITKYHLAVAEEVFNHFGCDLEDCYICQGETKLPFLELRDGKKEITLTKDDEEREKEQRAIHLLPPEEKRKTPQIQGFLADRARKWNKKLSMYDLDGNFKGVMPMAKYNFYKRYGLGDSRVLNKPLVEEIENDDEIHNLIVNCSSDDIFISLYKADSDNEFYNCIVEINGVEMPLWVVDLKCEKIKLNGEVVYAPHIEVNEKYRHLGLGFKLYKAFLECVGNMCRNERHTYNREEMPHIYNKLNKEPNIEVEDFYNESGELTHRIARLLSH